MSRTYVRVCVCVISRMAYADGCWLLARANVCLRDIIIFISIYIINLSLARRASSNNGSGDNVRALDCVCVFARLNLLACVNRCKLIQHEHRTRWCRPLYRNAYIAPLDSPGLIYHDRTERRVTNIRINLICFSTSNFPYLAFTKNEEVKSHFRPYLHGFASVAPVFYVPHRSRQQLTFETR